MFHETPYYYASIIVHPDHGLDSFKKHWKGYAPCIKEIKTGMESFAESFGQKAVQEGRSVRRKLPEAVL